MLSEENSQLMVTAQGNNKREHFSGIAAEAEVRAANGKPTYTAVHRAPNGFRLRKVCSSAPGVLTLHTLYTSSRGGYNFNDQWITGTQIYQWYPTNYI